MRKTLGDLARHVQSIILPATGVAYAIDPVFTGFAGEEAVREGVAAFRVFLHRLCDVLIADGDLYDTRKKIAHEYENRSGTSVYYPFLNHVKKLLLNIGFHGTLTESARSITFGNNVFNPKIPVSKSVECLRFLADCGISVDGVDLTGKKPDLFNIETLTIAYPGHPAMLTGLKVMAMAEMTLGTLNNWDIFLRCDYRALMNGGNDAASIFKDTIAPLPVNIRDFVLRLHRRCLDKGLTCEAEIKDFWILVKHSYKRKELWGLNKSLNNGFQLSVKAANTDLYADAIRKFPMVLQEMIAKGYGCGRKRSEIGHCDGGCRGLRISLDDTIWDICSDIETWFDLELACLCKK